MRITLITNQSLQSFNRFYKLGTKFFEKVKAKQVPLQLYLCVCVGVFAKLANDLCPREQWVYVPYIGTLESFTEQVNALCERRSEFSFLNCFVHKSWSVTTKHMKNIYHFVIFSSLNNSVQALECLFLELGKLLFITIIIQWILKLGLC